MHQLQYDGRTNANNGLNILIPGGISKSISSATITNMSGEMVETASNGGFVSGGKNSLGTNTINSTSGHGGILRGMKMKVSGSKSARDGDSTIVRDDSHDTVSELSRPKLFGSMNLEERAAWEGRELPLVVTRCLEEVEARAWTLKDCTESLAVSRRLFASRKPLRSIVFLYCSRDLLLRKMVFQETSLWARRARLRPRHRQSRSCLRRRRSRRDLLR